MSGYLRRVAIVLWGLVAVCDAGAATPEGDLTRIAFGSCSRHDAPQPMWSAIVDAEPDLWIWSGDIVYGDTEDMQVLGAKYELQKSRPEYRRMLTAFEIIGIYDDHDYGVNNGGREYGSRAESQRLLLDFLDVPSDSPRRRRAGAYGVYAYGAGDRRVKVLLLDTRYHRDPPSADGDVLGDAQWEWLERELTAGDAAVHVIVSSIQVVPEDHRYEKWSNFPAARRRLFDLVRRSGAPGVVFVSGDRHIAEISRLDPDDGGYPLYDITSSGLTHSWSSFPGEPNRHRLGEVFAGLHYGLLELDWDAQPPALELQIRDRHNRVRCRQRVSLSVLAPR